MGLVADILQDQQPQGGFISSLLRQPKEPEQPPVQQPPGYPPPLQQAVPVYPLPEPRKEPEPAALRGPELISEPGLLAPSPEEFRQQQQPGAPQGYIKVTDSSGRIWRVTPEQADRADRFARSGIRPDLLPQDVQETLQVLNDAASIEGEQQKPQTLREQVFEDMERQGPPDPLLEAGTAIAASFASAMDNRVLGPILKTMDALGETTNRAVGVPLRGARPNAEIAPGLLSQILTGASEQGVPAPRASDEMMRTFTASEEELGLGDALGPNTSAVLGGLAGGIGEATLDVANAVPLSVLDDLATGGSLRAAARAGSPEAARARAMTAVDEMQGEIGAARAAQRRALRREASNRPAPERPLSRIAETERQQGGIVSEILRREERPSVVEAPAARPEPAAPRVTPDEPLARPGTEVSFTDGDGVPQSGVVESVQADGRVVISQPDASVPGRSVVVPREQLRPRDPVRPDMTEADLAESQARVDDLMATREEPQPTPEAPTPVRAETAAVETPAFVEPVFGLKATKRRVNPASVQTDAKRYQFKSGGDSEGVVGTLSDVERWNPVQANQPIIHERADGSLFVADGHQRLDLARRAQAAGQDDVLFDAIILKEADGWTVDDVRALAAIKNIAEGSPTAIDAAKVIKHLGTDHPVITNLPRSKVAVRDGLELAKLGDDAFEIVINGQVPEAYAAHVGRMFSDPAEQSAAMRRLRELEPQNTNQARAMVQDIRMSGFASKNRNIVEGGVQGDLFGDAGIVMEDLTKERAQVLDAAANSIRRDKRLFRAIVHGEGPLFEAGNKLNVEGNRGRLSENEQFLAALEEARYVGPVAEALNRAARRVKSGETVRRVLPGFIEDVRKTVESTGGLGTETGRPVTSASEPATPRTAEPEAPATPAEPEFLEASTGTATRPRPTQPASTTPAQPGPAPPPPTRPTTPTANIPERTPVRETIDLPSRQDYARRMKKILDTRVQYRRMKGAKKTTPARFHTKRNMIEMQRTGDLDSLFHESGHRMDEVHGLSSSRFTQNAQSELDALGDPSRTGSMSSWKPGQSVDIRRKEGMGEFLRDWMLDPARANIEAPNVVREFEAFLDEHPKLKRELGRMKADLETAIRAPAQARVRSQIVTGHQGSQMYNWDWFLTRLIDDLLPLERLMESVAESRGVNMVRPGDDIYLKARMYRHLAGVFNDFLGRRSLATGKINGGPLKFGTREPTGTRPLQAILEDIGDDPQRSLDFVDYLVARRARELHARTDEAGNPAPIETGLDHADVEETFRTLHSAEFDRMANELYQWQDDVLQYGIDSGFISPEAADAWRTASENYVPFHRVFEVGADELPQVFTGNGRGLTDANVQSTRKLRGSGAEIINPLESMIRNMVQMVQAAEKHDIALALGRLYDEQSANIGSFIREVQGDRLQALRAQDSIDTGELRRQLKQAGVDVSNISVKDLDQMMAVMPPAWRKKRLQNAGANTVRLQMPDGSVRFFEMSPELYRAWMNLDRDQVHIIADWLGRPGDILRTGATKLSIPFQIRNPARDSMTAAMVSRVGSKPVENTLRGIAMMLGDAEKVAEWSRQGGGAELAQLLDQEGYNAKLGELVRGLQPEQRRKLVLPKRMWQALKKRPGEAAARLRRKARGKGRLAEQSTAILEEGLTSPLELLTRYTEMGENAARLAEYQRALEYYREKFPEWSEWEVRQRAAFESQDLIDFAMTGASMKNLRRIVPFLGSKLTGNYRLLKALKEAPPAKRAGILGMKAAGTVVRGLSYITLPTLAFYYINTRLWDKERYDQIPQEQKDIWWFVPDPTNPDGEPYRIPKPFLEGTLFGTIPERIITMIDNQDPRALDGLWSKLMTEILPADPTNPAAAMAEMSGPGGKAILELGTNTDFYRTASSGSRRSIVPEWMRMGDKKAPELEYDEFTSATAKYLGKTFGLSPKMVDHVVKGMAGTGGRQIVESVADPLVTAATDTEPALERPRDFLGLRYQENYSTSEQKFRDLYDELTIGDSRAEAAGERYEYADILAQMKRAQKQMRDLRKKARTETDEAKRKEYIRRARDIASKFTPATGPNVVDKRRRRRTR